MISNNTYPLVLEQIANQLAIVRSELSKNIYAEKIRGGIEVKGKTKYRIVGILAELAWLAYSKRKQCII